jgi:hypothetical protein
MPRLYYGSPSGRRRQEVRRLRTFRATTHDHGVVGQD